MEAWAGMAWEPSGEAQMYDRAHNLQIMPGTAFVKAISIPHEIAIKSMVFLAPALLIGDYIMARPMPRCKNRIQSNVRNINDEGHPASGWRRSIVSKNKKTIEQTHFPVSRLPTVNYRDFSAFGLRKLPSFLSAHPPEHPSAMR